MLKSTIAVFLVYFVAGIISTVVEPNGLVIPQDSANGEQQLYTFLANAGENINWRNDAHTQPSTFNPQQSINVQIVLQQSGARSGLGWYNADGTSNPSIHQILSQSSSVGATVNALDIVNSPYYTGGSIGFALISGASGTNYYSEDNLNPYCSGSSCNPHGNWILSVKYQSTKYQNAYYLAFEDGPVSSNGYSNDGDYNDDVFLIRGIVAAPPPNSVCGNGVKEGQEECDGGDCCTSTCGLASTVTVCRASTGACDAAEYCNGLVATCPADSVSSAGTICRASTGVCDQAEYCTGSSGVCPADSFSSSSTVCRASTGVCDQAEYCSGSTGSCPADSFASSSTVCRASTGVCDAAEFCTGSSGACPADSKSSASTVCRASTGVCDQTEYCTGTSGTCPADSFSSSSTVCRSSNGVCDVAEYCTGSTGACPADSFSSSSTVCRSSAGVCDVAEYCSGSSASCPSDSVASSSTVCRSSAGICDITEYCTGSNVNCPSDVVATSARTCRSSIGPCDPSESCDGTHVTCPNDISGSWETACPGLNLVLNGNSYSWLNFDVISFGGFNANTGDIEGRLAVRNSASVGSGWSVGYQTHSVGTDQTLPYGMVVGGDLSWGSGAAYPDGSNAPYAGAEEDVFVGGSFSGPSYLSGRVTGQCSSSGCLNSQFDAVQSCYAGYQNSLASLSDNVQHTIQWSGLYISCSDPSSTQYVISLTQTDMSQYTWISLDQCNPNARWIINLRGTSDMTITGGSFPASAASVVWNFIGSGRTLTITNTQVDGSILAPYNNINQPSGVVLGKVIANNVAASLQVNKAQCFIPHN